MSTPAQDEARARMNDAQWGTSRVVKAARARVADRMAPRRDACRPPVDCPTCPSNAGEFCQSPDGTHYSQPGQQLYVHAARRALL